MTENEMLDKAIAIAAKAHQGQTDRYGSAYILHVLRVGLSGNSMNEKITGILHDVIEDSELNEEDLIREGFPAEIVDAVSALTKKEGENYGDFIQRTLKNPLAAKVKEKDLMDNLNLLRVKGFLSKEDLERLNKYLTALSVLRES